MKKNPPEFLTCTALLILFGSCAPAELEPCAIEPTCSLFSGTGVEVGMDDTGDYVVVRSDGLAQHTMGPYGQNPNTASGQDYEFKIPIKLAKNGAEQTALGPMAVAFNGVPFFNMSDGRPFAGCTGNAGFLESDHIDPFGGHPTQHGQYHYHGGQFLAKAAELELSHSPSAHSSLLGYALDGYPIYGPYGYSIANDPKSSIKLLGSCYRTKPSRTCCTDASTCGPAVTYDGKTLILGAFIEDFEFVQADLDSETCDLNSYNMRFQTTPEYPEGTWAYIVTVDATGTIAFPYVIGLKYFGDAQTDTGQAGPR